MLELSVRARSWGSCCVSEAATRRGLMSVDSQQSNIKQIFQTVELLVFIRLSSPYGGCQRYGQWRAMKFFTIRSWDAKVLIDSRTFNCLRCRGCLQVPACKGSMRLVVSPT